MPRRARARTSVRAPGRARGGGGAGADGPISRMADAARMSRWRAARDATMDARRRAFDA